jgi:hypothetical protein
VVIGHSLVRSPKFKFEACVILLYLSEIIGVLRDNFYTDLIMIKKEKSC